MKVLVISASFPPMQSGGSDYALRLCRELAEAGLQVRVLTSAAAGETGAGQTNAGQTSNQRLEVLPLMREWSWRELPKLLRVARDFKPDVVDLQFVGAIYHHHPMITFAPFLLKRMLKRTLPRLRFVTHMESDGGIHRPATPFVARQVWRFFARQAGIRRAEYEFGTILRDSDFIIALSEVHRDAFIRHRPAVAEKCEVLPPPPIMPMSAPGAASRRRGREMLGVAPDEFLFAYFGYIYPTKGIETLLEAFAIVHQSRPKTRLVLIGGSNDVLLKEIRRPDYLQEMRARATELDLDDAVIWTGYYPTGSDTASLYLHGADGCVLPFDNGVRLNNSSFTAAAAHGLPIVTTRPENVEAPFVDGENLCFVPPQDAAALAVALEVLIDDDDRRRHLSEGACHLADEWFSWKRSIARTLQIFRDDASEATAK